MSDRPIQRYTGNVPAGPQGTNVMTAQGPATIQIIDMPSGALGPANAGGGGPARRKPGGINVVGAVVRRWWLVLVVFVIVGGASWFAGANLVKPSFEARAKVSYQDTNAGNGGGLASTTIHRAISLMNSREIPINAWDRPEMASLFPKIGGRNLKDPVEQATLLAMVRDFVDTDESTKGTSVIDVISIQNTPDQARASANAYADALVSYCNASVHEGTAQQLVAYQKELEDTDALLKALLAKSEQLRLDNEFATNQQKMVAAFDAIKTLEADKNKASVETQVALDNVERLKKGGVSSGQLLEEAKFIKDETAKDSFVATYLALEMTAVNDRMKLIQEGKTEEHPLVTQADKAIASAKSLVAAREKEIKETLDTQIKERQRLTTQDTLEVAQQKADTLQSQLRIYTDKLKTLSAEQRRFAGVQAQLKLLDNEASAVAQQKSAIQETVNQARRDSLTMPTASFKVEQLAAPTLKEDKRIKVQAGGAVGGLFLGILLALLVDKFDKRLRDPRDIEPLFGATLLGTIPRIQELKRIKGEQARNLIAEEFRIIRTQVLFGNPNLTQKLIGITSPNPGDGKTSLAVNLAISIAKAGRRVLLIDGDLRKPDVHRVFNVSDSPGFAEVIQGSHEPGAVIKKSEIEGLEILPAGTPLTRPSELLSRPEVGRLLLAMSELYDHIVLDTAPLLPVSDTHVLAGMMDGVIVSFNAEVDRDTIALTQEILRRSRANIIGSVMNQVKYRQSGSYHRGKTAYDSYYNSPRGAQQGKSDKLATVGKH